MKLIVTIELSIKKKDRLEISFVVKKQLIVRCIVIVSPHLRPPPPPPPLLEIPHKI